ncbi:Maintenance of ploidy protein mob2 [Mycoemilia scoparia]|uniref:Maintenance of ploidy protein mob2 n=1 Tax=Mycoemilia scoparia TaxID=417184 RepID=A0A9W8A2Z2_9FUNG|nr:Maintenance of ploidy protein mob2 [Mycoemilia scoparia]
MSFFGKLANIKQKRPTTPTTLKTTEPPLFIHPKFSSAHLVKGSFKGVVQLPKYVDVNEWLASNTFEFFNLINLFYGIITNFCTMSECSIMNAGPLHEYTWTDTQRKTVKLSAPQYIDYVLSQVQTMLDDERAFPTKSRSEFPRDFGITLRVIYRQLFRVLAHIYWSHYEVLVNLRCEGHLNSLFAHFISFAKEFDLIDKKELVPMSDLIGLYEQQEVIP